MSRIIGVKTLRFKLSVLEYAVKKAHPSEIFMTLFQKIFINEFIQIFNY